MSKEKQTPAHLSKLSEVMLNNFAQVIQGAANVNYTKDPEVKVRNIIEYESKMRSLGMEKFNGPCFVSATNLYKSDNDLKNKNTCGVLLVFLEEESAARVLKSAGLRNFHEDDPEEMFKACSEFGTNLFQGFGPELSKAGYSGLVNSPFVSFRNDIPQGVDFPYNEYQMVELSLDLWKKPAIVIDLVLTPH